MEHAGGTEEDCRVGPGRSTRYEGFWSYAQTVQRVAVEGDSHLDQLYLVE